MNWPLVLSLFIGTQIFMIGYGFARKQQVYAEGLIWSLFNLAQAILWVWVTA